MPSVEKPNVDQSESNKNPMSTSEPIEITPQTHNNTANNSQANLLTDSDDLKGQATHVAQNAKARSVVDKEGGSSSLNEELPPEHGGQSGPEPTRYGDWEKKGRCTDF